MLDRFDYDTYTNLLELLRKTNMNVTFEDFPLPDNSIRYFILRHDVDFCPEAALRMAELEAKMGIRASYFVLLSTPYYNLLSEQYLDFPRRLVEMGHEVGLHYDVRVYTAFGRDRLLEALESHSFLLAKLSGKRVKSIAMHNPSISGEDPFRSIKQFINAYDDQYTKEIMYLSDSCGAWRDEAVSVLEIGNIPSCLQLLIHPLFWDRETANRWARLDEFMQSKVITLREDIQRVKGMWAQHPGLLQHDRRR
jgi:peptidoglycan/xylan/chitin deacetylase (PgdA/CDA1 family)